VTAFVLGVAGSATAQSGSAGASGSATGQVGFERRPQLSVQDELSQSSLILSRLDQGAATVRRQLESAREARDVVKTLCLNDKLSQIDVAIRSGRDRQTALQAAAQRNDSDLANHEFTILTVLGQRGQELVGEANQCLGEEVAFVGQTQVTTEIDPDIPGEDTTEYPPGDPTLISGPPVAVSPTH
jgi:hypothetical protein